VSKSFSVEMQEYMQEFIRKFEDDFNIPEVLALFYLLNKFVNTNIRDEVFSLEELKSLLDFYKTINEVLAIIDFDIISEKTEIPEEVSKKLKDRNNAKIEKDFELADKLRGELLELGYKIVDNRDGSRVEKI
jgi:cysteinyl-tRNA synthetase